MWSPGASHGAPRAPEAVPIGGAIRAASTGRHRLTLVVDPRFPGGTSTATAAEIRALAPRVDLDIVGVETRMFHSREINPALQGALDSHGLSLRWSPLVIRADTIVIHNPACLKFETSPPPRMSCDTAVAVTHENFLRPGGGDGFDVAHCLSLCAGALTCRSRWLAPVSAVNRRSVEVWLQDREAGSGWRLAPFDWPNICDMEHRPPTPAPRDLRGRHSRPGLEKFPDPETMARHFPPHAERCVILGGDALLMDPDSVPPHWDVRRFGESDVADFLEEIDFLVYFTHPLWRESFGRSIAEAIAAGKVVITDPATAESFGPSVVASEGDDVDEIIAAFVTDPARYAAFVAQAQNWLAGLAPDRVADHLLGGLDRLRGAPDAVL